jgi:CheY-like chemotaxis protein
VKFTARGEVTVKFSSQIDASNNVNLSFEVKDTGCGFTEAECTQLFVPFFQADESAARRFGGAGLGLAISRRLAVALGGDITVTQYGVNQGATFLVTISANQPSAMDKGISDDSTSVAVVPENALQGLQFLVVDDAVDNQFLTKYILESWGGKVDVSNSGVEALDMLEQKDYDIVLLDIQMPVLDGYQTLARIRQKGFKMPGVAVTAHAMNEDFEKTKVAGFASHLTKPLDFDALIRVLGRVSGK